MKTTDFQKGVLRTCSADFQKISPRLNEWAVNFLHGLCGMADEIGELLLADDKPNAIEELGDFLWYDALSYHAIGKEFYFDSESCIDGRYSDMKYTIEIDCNDIMKHVGELNGMFKAYLFYGREFDAEKAYEQLSKVTRIAFGCCYRIGSSPEDVMRKNQEKLRARYPEKYFTEERANERDLEKEQAILRDKPTPEVDLPIKSIVEPFVPSSDE